MKSLIYLDLNTFHNFFIIIMIMGVLTGCVRTGSTLTSQPLNGNVNIIPTRTTAAASSPSTPICQLTYVSTCIDSYDCVYSMNVKDMETNNPRFDPPILLFEIPKNGNYPKPPITQILWSSDGEQVILDGTGIMGKSDIFIGNWSGDNWVNITYSPLWEGGAQWGVQEQQIFYVGKTEEFGHIRLFSVNTEGNSKGEIFLDTNSYFDDIDAFALSPDGTKIVFSKTIDLISQLFIVNLDGSNLQQLTSGQNDHFEPQFSPDGEWVLYRQETGTFSEQNEKGSESRLFLIRPDGSEKKEILVDSLKWKGFFAWAPVGNWIAFMAEASGHYYIYIIRPDGTGLTQVSPSNSEADFPAWRMILP